jgi:hypothetical protein
MGGQSAVSDGKWAGEGYFLWRNGRWIRFDIFIVGREKGEWTGFDIFVE